MKFLEEIKYAAGKATLSLKRNAPTILMGAGVVGVVGSAVLACVATRKLDSILEEKNKKIDSIHRKQEDEELRQSGKFTEKDAKKELTMVYMETGKDLAKLYAPSVIWGIGSLTALIGSHILLNERIVTLATSYTAILSSFNHYRDNVKERFGEKVDFQLKHNIKTSEIEVTNVDEKGNTTTFEIEGSSFEVDYTTDLYDDSIEICGKEGYWNAAFFSGIISAGLGNYKLQLSAKNIMPDVFENEAYNETSNTLSFTTFKPLSYKNNDYNDIVTATATPSWEALKSLHLNGIRYIESDNKIILKLPYFDTYYEVYPHEYLVKAPYLLADSNDSLHYEISSYIPLAPHVIDKSACKWYLELAAYTRPNDEIV